MNSQGTNIDCGSSKCPHCGSIWEYDWEYCPECNKNYGGAVYPNKTTENEVNDANAIIDLINIAFINVGIEDGETIHEAHLEGAYFDDSVRVAARNKDPEKKWDEVPDWKLERLSSTLSFLDPKGWRFYLPAFMIWTLRNWRTSNSITTFLLLSYLTLDTEAFSLPRYESLSIQQSKCVYNFLVFFCKYSGAIEAREAMDSYWHKFEIHGI